MFFPVESSIINITDWIQDCNFKSVALFSSDTKTMIKKSIHLCILLFFLNLQFVFSQSSSDDFSNITDTPSELIVRLHRNASIEQLKTLSKRLGAVTISPIFSPATPAGQHPQLRRNYLIRFPTGWALEPLQQRYERHAAIEAVEKNRLNQLCAETAPNDPSYTEQWNLTLLNMPQAWEIERGKPQITVAVVDSGIATQHLEFRERLWENVNEIPGNGIDDDRNGYIDDRNGWDFSDAPTLLGGGDWTERDNAPEDETGHGTHVSGIIAAAVNNGIGVAGITQNCRLMPVRVSFKFGGGTYIQNDDAAAAIVYAADNGAQVINMSWGDTVRASIIEDAIEYAYQRGCVLVSAAGNSAILGSYYPAALKNVISVAGLGRERQMYDSSNFGATVNIAAPAEEILSTSLNDGYQTRSGTSMAAAHVSGVAALVLSANPHATNIEVQEKLIATAKPLFITEFVGAGSLDAHAALVSSTPFIAQIDTQRTSQQTLESIEILGSAGGTEFTEYWLEYGIGELPNLWFPLGTVQTKPKLNACLHKWDTSTLAEGRYTLRLSVKLTDEDIKRVKTVVDVRHKSPLILRHESHPWLVGNRLDSVVIWQTAELTTGKVEILTADGNVDRTIHSDAENLLHIANLSDLGISQGIYTYRLVVQNRAGFQHIDDNNGKLYRIEVRDAAIHPSSLSQVASADRGLHAIVSPVDINGNGRLELFAVEIGAGTAQIFEITDNNTYDQIFAFTESFLPWAAADTDDDGLIEILGNVSGTTFLLEQPAQGEFPTKRIWEAQGDWSRTIVDADADGIPEIFARNDATNSISVYEADGDNNHSIIATLENPTVGNNGISANFATGDFDGDGRTEILVGDDDGELFIYEATGNNQYKQTWKHTLSEGTPQLFAAGDLDGDGNAEFAICAKTGTQIGNTILDIRYYHWLLSIFSLDSDDTYQLVWQQRISDVNDGGNGMTIADANSDGQNELCISVQPNFYLIQYDGTTYRTIWHHSATSTFEPIVTNLNGSDTNMLLFNSNNALSAFSVPTAENSLLSTPWRITAKPIDRHSIRLTWQPVQDNVTYIIYRGVSENELEQVHSGTQETHFTDTELTTGRTYWYALASKHSGGKISAQSESVSVVPTERPRLQTAAFSPPNQLLLQFNKQMGTSATHAGRYRLYKEKNMENGSDNYTPRSALLDKARKRVVLTFSPEVFRTGNHYQIEALQLSDIYGASLADDANTLTITFSAPTLAEVIVYPNPAEECNQVTFDRLPTRTSIYIYDVSGNCVASLMRTEREKDRRFWDLTGISSGVYVYVLSSETDQRVGKLSVIR